MGQRLGHLSESVVSLITIVGLFTIAVSTYLIIYSDKLYLLLEPVYQSLNAKGPSGKEGLLKTTK